MTHPHPERHDEDTLLAHARRYQLTAQAFHRDYLRALRRLLPAVASGRITKTRIARTLEISDADVSEALRQAAEIDETPEGFSGATPIEIAERYAAGLIDRSQMIDELSRFPYASEPGPENDVDWLAPAPEDPTWADVRQAQFRGLITNEDYTEILDRRKHSDRPRATER